MHGASSAVWYSALSDNTVICRHLIYQESKCAGSQYATCITKTCVRASPRVARLLARSDHSVVLAGADAGYADMVAFAGLNLGLCLAPELFVRSPMLPLPQMICDRSKAVCRGTFKWYSMVFITTGECSDWWQLAGA